jgi:HEAT repeat protein
MSYDLATFLTIDGFFAPGASITAMIAALDDERWEIQQAAANGLGARQAAEAAPALVRLLDRQDELDIYGLSGEMTLADAPDAATEAVWKCRFRVKQSAIHALADIGERHGLDAVGERTIQKLARYAIDTDEDYTIRAAACQALGRMKAATARAALEKAAGDGEWCTAMEASKSLARLTRQ